jgi:hypothetical protein
VARTHHSLDGRSGALGRACGDGHAPDLTAIGARHLGVSLEIQQLRCPECVKPGSAMPSFESLGTKRLHDLAVFLGASKGLRSSGN